MVEGIIYRYRTGIAWRDLPETFGKWQTVWTCHRRLASDGTWDGIHSALTAHAAKNNKVDFTVSVDSTIARAVLGFALSTTQVASGSVLGSGLGRKGADVQWSTAGRIASGWLLTIPAAALVGGAAAGIAHLGVVGVIIDSIIAVVAVLWIFLSSRRVEETDISNLDTVAEAVNIRGRKRKLRKDRKRVGAKGEARRDAWNGKHEVKQKRRASRDRRSIDTGRQATSTGDPGSPGDSAEIGASREMTDRGDVK